MSCRRLLLLAVLVYVTLDPSLPAMPGAFVFEPEDSTESTHVRARGEAEVIASLALSARPGLAGLVPPPAVMRPSPVEWAERRPRPFAARTSQVSADPSPTSEDPH